MKQCFLVPLVLLAAAVGAEGLTLRRAATGSPVERIVKLLTDLRDNLEADQKEEQRVYDQYACFCETTTAKKAQAILDATNDIRAFGQTILSLKGAAATLTQEIRQLEAQIRDAQMEIEQATVIRQKENAAFVADTTELKQAIAAMDKAITVLVAGSSSLLQTTARDQVKAVVEALPASRSLKPGQMSFLSDFLRSGYAPQSMTVQGILKDMFETFATDLESSTQAEATANADFEGLMFTKTSEITALEQVKADKEAQKASTEQQLADTQAMYDDTQEQRKVDIEFFDETKKACQSKHDAWMLLKGMRAEEIAGIGEALKILTSDAARAVFQSAIKTGDDDAAPAFLQLSSPVAKAYAVLRASAGAGHSLRLAKLAAQVRLGKAGHFEEVLKAIDDMVRTLRDEDAADIAKRDQCKEEYLKIESTMKDLNWKIEKNDAKIATLSNLIEELTAKIGKTVEEIKDVDSQMETLTKERTADNEEFHKGKEMDQQAIALLTTARDAFAAFSKKNAIDLGPVQGPGRFLQESKSAASADQAPDAEKAFRKGESKGVISMMTHIIESVEGEIESSIKAEEAAQVEYETQMKAAQKLKDELLAKKVTLEGAAAEATTQRSDELEDKDVNVRGLDDEVKYKKSITPDCDGIFGAFEGRAKARVAEMNGLTGAKEFLAGAQP